MIKSALLLAAITFSLSASAQFLEISPTMEVCCFPIYDSMGNITFIKKSSVEEYKSPSKATKIYHFNNRLDTLGYWYGEKKRYVSFIKPVVHSHRKK